MCGMMILPGRSPIDFDALARGSALYVRERFSLVGEKCISV